MSSASPFTPPSAENMGLQDSTDSAQTPSLQQRPPFLRATTSPLPVLSAFAAQDPADASSTASVHPHTAVGYFTGEGPLDSGSHRKLRPGQQELLPRPFSPSIFSSFTSSVRNVLASSASSTRSNSSTTDTLIRERRMSAGQTHNWVPSYTRSHQSDGTETHPSPITAVEASAR